MIILSARKGSKARLAPPVESRSPPNSLLYYLRLRRESRRYGSKKHREIVARTSALPPTGKSTWATKRGKCPCLVDSSPLFPIHTPHGRGKGREKTTWKEHDVLIHRVQPFAGRRISVPYSRRVTVSKLS